MSRGSRLALVALAVAMIVAPAAALHPVVAHLYAAGLSNLLVEWTHPPVLGFAALAVLSVVPTVGFSIAVLRATRGIGHLRTLRRTSRPRSLNDLPYRLLARDQLFVFTAGFIHPTVFVSVGAERTLGEAGLRAALLHEQAHQRSQDIIWRLLLRGVGRAFALVPGISAVIESETLRTECAADDHAIRCGADRLDLFDAIVAASGSQPSVLAIGLTDANVELRLARLVHPETPLPGRPVRSFVALTAGVALPALTAHAMVIGAAVCASHLTL